MIDPERLYHFLREKGISFYTGVPDSLLKHFLKFIQDHAAANEHIITANEGLAVALASGYHLSNGKLPLVYLQNSGLGNIINPLTSLADKEMYSIPIILLIGWRGMPGTYDEPQHVKMGRITIPLLELLGVPVYLLDGIETSCFDKISRAIREATDQQKPVALLVPGEIFENYEGVIHADKYSLQREEVIKKLIASMTGEETVICTTGKAGREFYDQNNAAGKKISRYLMNVGAMGHSSHIALGLQNRPGEKIIILDGDGSLLMHMGGLPTLAHHAGGHFIHIVINNGSHESVGGQPTEGFTADLCKIASASGYHQTVRISDNKELEQWLKNDLPAGGVRFVEIRINKKSQPGLGRPTGKPADWKKSLLDAFSKRK
jgi:phosphonopyruvate decarboxylase